VELNLYMKIVIWIVVLVIAGVLAFYFLGKKTDPSNTSDTGVNNGESLIQPPQFPQ
jgi:flagellar basal body-associated protein FliL